MSEEERPDIPLKEDLTAPRAQRPAEPSGHQRLASTQVAPCRSKLRTEATSVQMVNAVRYLNLFNGTLTLTCFIDSQRWSDRANGGLGWKEG